MNTDIQKFNKLRDILLNRKLHLIAELQEINDALGAPDETVTTNGSPRRHKTHKTQTTSTPASKPTSKPTKTRKRLKRRSLAQIRAAGDKIAALLKKDGKLRAEEIRGRLGLDVREIPRAIQEAIADGKIRIAGGQKRATTYAATSSSPKPAKKPAKKK